MSESPEQKLVRRARHIVQEARDRQAAHKGSRHAGPTLRDFTTMFIALEDACDEVEGIKNDAERKSYVAKTRKDGSSWDGEMREEHESFGLAIVHRHTHSGSGTHLFGSALDKHPTTLVLSVMRGQRIHSNLAYDRFFHADENHHVVEVEFSAAQFADLITNPGMGVGFPCTIRNVAGVDMEAVPVEHKSEQTHIVENFQSELKDVEASFQPQVQEAQEILAKKSIGKADRQRLSDLIREIVRFINDHAPHVANMFSEATDKMMTTAKSDIEAYASSVIQAAGVAHINSLQPPAPTIEVEAAPTAKIEGTSEKDQ